MVQPNNLIVMKTELINTLKTTPQNYELMVFDIYVDWCSTKCKNKRSLQKLLICAPLFNWWYRQLEVFEKDFVTQTQPFKGELSKSLAKDYYLECTQGIYKLFSKPLIKKANDIKSITKQN